MGYCKTGMKSHANIIEQIDSRPRFCNQGSLTQLLFRSFLFLLDRLPSLITSAVQGTPSASTLSRAPEERIALVFSISMGARLLVSLSCLLVLPVCGFVCLPVVCVSMLPSVPLALSLLSDVRHSRLLPRLVQEVAPEV